MFNAAFAVAISLLAQAGPIDSFFKENEEAVVYSYSPELQEATALRILDWGRRGGWPANG
jgi:hypothetical protein